MTENNGSGEQPGFLIPSSEAFKIAQALYNSVTGKTEKLSKRFSENYKIGLNDIHQLHAKIDQMCAQWNVINKSENITVHHVNDNKQTFSSIDRFKIYDQSQTAPIESIVYEFNLLIQLSNTPKPQPYQIVVRLASPIAMHHKAREEVPAAIFLRFFRGESVNVDIQYVDYVVARNIMSTIDSWISAIELVPPSKALKLLQRYSYWYDRICGLFLMIAALLASSSSIQTVFAGNESNEFLATFLIWAFGFTVISYFIGNALGNFVESGVDGVTQSGYIKINSGDARLISTTETKNYRSFAKAAVALVLMSLHAIACSYLATILYESLK